MHDLRTSSFAAVTLAGLALTGCSSPSGADGSSENPQRSHQAFTSDATTDFPDPAILPWQGAYYAFGTGDHIQSRVSYDLNSWSPVTPALRTTPGWADASRTWAPMVLPINNTFVLYYAVALAGAYNSNGQPVMCLSRAVAYTSTPAGPYDDYSGGPMVCQQDLGGSIDPSAYYDENMTPWLVWKSDGNCCNIATQIFSAQLAWDGQSLAGGYNTLLTSGNWWEHGVIEGPSLTRNGGQLYLFYSGNYWNTEYYSIGYAVCSAPWGPCYDQSVKNAWVWSNAPANAWGPGGQEWFRDLWSGQLYMSYHAWDSEAATGKRTLRYDPVSFDGNGTPDLTFH